MEFTAAQLDAWIAGLALSFMRIAALLLAAPLFGARSVPMQVRAGLALVVALTVQPLLPPPPEMSLLSFSMVLAMLRELVIGAVAGFVLQMVFAALAIAGEVVALGMGLGFASLVDPDSGVQVPVVGQLFVVLSTLLFLALDGHLLLINFMVVSFSELPLGGGIRLTDFAALADWGSVMFGHAVLIALPAVGSLLLANVAMGVVTRAAPQLNIFAVGFPMTLMLGFLVLWATLGALGARFTELLGEGFSVIGWWLGG